MLCKSYVLAFLRTYARICDFSTFFVSFGHVPRFNFRTFILYNRGVLSFSYTYARICTLLFRELFLFMLSVPAHLFAGFINAKCS